jgi:hypothetical protein
VADRLTVVTMSHNPATADLFVGQNWIDEYRNLAFPLERTWAWEACYDLYPEEFDGKRELRWILPERRSLYRPDLTAKRPRQANYELIQPVGMACEPYLDRRELVDALMGSVGKVLVHPFAGEVGRWIPEEIARPRLREYRFSVVAGDYERMGHAREWWEPDGTFSIGTYSPRSLMISVKHAAAVLAAESSVYYMASMFGRPVCMCYAPDATFDRVQRGLSDWHWYYGLSDPKNLFLRMHGDAWPDEMSAWLKARVDEDHQDHLQRMMG